MTGRAIGCKCRIRLLVVFTVSGNSGAGSRIFDLFRLLAVLCPQSWIFFYFVSVKTRYLILLAILPLLQALVRVPTNQLAGKRQLPTQIPTISWDSTTLTKISASGPEALSCGYARMIQLHDRSLFTIYEASGNVVCVKSHDLGKTWTDLVTIAAKEDGTNMAVPDILELKDHTLLACYNPRPYKIDTARRFAIRIKTSTDGGRTWGGEQTLYQAGHEFANGCWEPSAIQLPSGEVLLYFANEAPYTHSNEQNISLLRSFDNARTWTPMPETISFRAGSRDGMPVPILLDKGKEIVFAIEDNGVANFKPYTISHAVKEKKPTTVTANSPQRRYALQEKIADSIYAGAPFIRQLKSGQTILSYQGTEGRRNKMEFAEMKVVIGDAQAKNFTGKTVPFSIPPDKHGLWNSLCILDDGTIVALTSTNAFSNRSEVWMIKGKLSQ
jgi:hypothetical protein